MPLPYQPWRAAMLPASYGGAYFAVESDAQAGGRRNVTHEFPKEDIPWTEDMGRKAQRWNITGYLIGPTYLDDRDALIEACETEGPQTLIHPTLGEVQANCDDYSSTERREQGGYCLFEMRFVEAGTQPDTSPTDDTQAQVNNAADSAGGAASTQLNTGLQAANNGFAAGPI